MISIKQTHTKIQKLKKIEREKENRVREITITTT